MFDHRVNLGTIDVGSTRVDRLYTTKQAAAVQPQSVWLFDVLECTCDFSEVDRLGHITTLKRNEKIPSGHKREKSYPKRPANRIVIVALNYVS